MDSVTTAIPEGEVKVIGPVDLSLMAALQANVLKEQRANRLINVFMMSEPTSFQIVNTLFKDLFAANNFKG